MKKTLATAQFCGPCGVLKKRIEKLDLEVETKTFEVKEDQDFFVKHGIRSVPRLVVEQDDGTVEIIQGSDEIIAAIQKDG